MLINTVALGGAGAPRVAVEASASVAGGDMDLMAGSVLLTRANARSAVSRSVNRVSDLRTVGIEACKPLGDICCDE
jgi:hypothetical protein